MLIQLMRPSRQTLHETADLTNGGDLSAATYPENNSALKHPRHQCSFFILLTELSRQTLQETADLTSRTHAPRMRGDFSVATYAENNSAS